MFARPFAFLFLSIAIVSLTSVKISAAEKTGPEKLLYTVKNHDAFLDERKAALRQLAQDPNDEFREALIEILEDQTESRIFHQYISEIAISMKDPAFYGLLKKKVSDKKSNTYLRQVALSILWKSNPESVLPLILEIVQDPFETVLFRIGALQYLTPMSKKPEVKEVMLKILNDPDELPKIKKLAMSLIEKSGDRKMDQRSDLAERKEVLQKRAS